jgi:hypothetical protein
MYSANFSSGDLVRKHNFMYVPLNASALQFDSRIWDGSTADSFRVLMGDTELGTLDISQTDQTWRSRSFAIPQALRNTVQTITFELTDGSGTNISEVDIDSVRFGMVTPVLASSLPPGSVIDLGRIAPHDSVVLPMAVSLANVGDAGSILDVFGLEYQILYVGNNVGQFNMFLDTPIALEVGDEPDWQRYVSPSGDGHSRAGGYASAGDRRHVDPDEASGQMREFRRHLHDLPQFARIAVAFGTPI